MRKIYLYLAIFIGGGFFGWVLDTAYRSLVIGEYMPGTLMPFFAFIYAFGAVMLYAFFSVGNISFWPQVIIGTVLCVALEFFGGVVSLYLLGYRLWDYSARPLNVYGFIDIEHAVYWFFLTVVYRFSHKFFESSSFVRKGR
ncbi:MAG: putative ABC transporter permease [Candidatus Magasanikbacteria bacterium]|nr:putative ABC transporter permease [Candidatus Magasanikbacteria bacterium]